MIYNKKISKNCKDFTMDMEKLCYVDARTGALLEVEYEETVSRSNIWITFNFYLCGSIWAENGYDN